MVGGCCRVCANQVVHCTILRRETRGLGGSSDYVRATDLEGIAGRRHSPTLSPSHGILSYAWFVWGLGLEPLV